MRCAGAPATAAKYRGFSVTDRSAYTAGPGHCTRKQVEPDVAHDRPAAALDGQATHLHAAASTPAVKQASTAPTTAPREVAGGQPLESSRDMEKHTHLGRNGACRAMAQ
jgi:hypothetical protein